MLFRKKNRTNKTDKQTHLPLYVERTAIRIILKYVLHVNATVNWPPYGKIHKRNKERENINHMWILLHMNIMFLLFFSLLLEKLRKTCGLLEKQWRWQCREKNCFIWTTSLSCKFTLHEWKLLRQCFMIGLAYTFITEN
jgi:hypothetical protein